VKKLNAKNPVVDLSVNKQHLLSKDKVRIEKKYQMQIFYFLGTTLKMCGHSMGEGKPGKPANTG
jgi:hypothetical protein